MYDVDFFEFLLNNYTKQTLRDGTVFETYVAKRSGWPCVVIEKIDSDGVRSNEDGLYVNEEARFKIGSIEDFEKMVATSELLEAIIYNDQDDAIEAIKKLK